VGDTNSESVVHNVDGCASITLTIQHEIRILTLKSRGQQRIPESVDSNYSIVQSISYFVVVLIELVDLEDMQEPLQPNT